MKKENPLTKAPWVNTTDKIVGGTYVKGQRFVITDRDVREHGSKENVIKYLNDIYGG